MFWNATIIHQIFVEIILPPREDLWDRHIRAWVGASDRNVWCTRAQCIGFTTKDAAQAESVSIHKVDTFQANPRLTPSSSLASRALCCRNWLKPAGPVWRGIFALCVPRKVEKAPVCVSHHQGFYWRSLIPVLAQVLASCFPQHIGMHFHRTHHCSAQTPYAALLVPGLYLFTTSTCWKQLTNCTKRASSS